ncbi:MAG: DUF177 domain-containing protein [Magnetococcus sp. YQC-9]
MESDWQGEDRSGSVSAPPWHRIGDPPRRLGGVNLDLPQLMHRAVPWQAVGVLAPEDFESLDEAGELQGVVEVLLEARPIRQEGRMVARVHGHLRGRMQLSCVRCLGQFDWPVEAGIEAVFALGSDPAAKNRNWRIEGDVEYLPDGVIEIRHLVEEELLLALPMNPICVSECAGLCAGCGADLNRAPCSCRKSEPNGPFAALKVLQST